MLGKNSNKNAPIEPGSVNLVGTGTKIVGDVSSAGDFRIDGNLNGHIVTNGKFVLGPNGLVEGNITCANADISGEVKGTVNVSEMLLLKSSARINGDIFTSKLSIEPGAVFTGNCNMGARVKNILQSTGELNGARSA